MFKKIALCVVLASFITIPVLAEEIQESTFPIEASVKREVEPDAAKVTFYVDNSGINLKELKKENDKIVSEAISAIKALLGSGEKVTTIAYSIRNIYSYKEKVRIFQKYEVKNGFEVKLKDIDKVSDIINAATSKGVKNVGNINFYVENSENICNEMMVEAVRIAKNRVQLLSTAAGATVGSVKTINPYCSLSANQYYQPKVNRVYMSSAAMDATGAQEEHIDSIEPGPINATARVNIIYYLK